MFLQLVLHHIIPISSFQIEGKKPFEISCFTNKRCQSLLQREYEGILSYIVIAEIESKISF